MGEVAWEWVWFLWFWQISKILIWYLKQRLCCLPIFLSCDCQVNTLQIRDFLRVRVHCSETSECCMSLCFCLDGPGSSGAPAGTAWTSQENVPFRGGASNDLDAWTTHNHPSLTAFHRRNGKMVLMRNAQGLKCKNENVLLKSKIK